MTSSHYRKSIKKRHRIICLLLVISLLISVTGCNKDISSSIALFSHLLFISESEVSFQSSKVGEGDIIEFGYYNSEPLEWIVLKINDGKMLVLSKYGLFGDDIDHRSFSDIIDGGYSWNTSVAREFLNSDDLIWSLFTENEQALILETAIETDANPFYESSGGKTSKDRLFLLSLFDVVESFETTEDAKCTQPDGDECSWWLRTPGSYERSMIYVDVNGLPNVEGISCLSDKTQDVFDGFNLVQRSSVLTLRPAMWVALDDYDPKNDTEYEDYEEEFFDKNYSHESTTASTTGTDNVSSHFNNVTVGSTIQIGAIDGQRLEWTVLDISGDKALVLCNYGIAYTYLNRDNRTFTWETCDVRENMNKDAFLNQIFSPYEQKLIVPTELKNYNNPDYKTNGGNDTTDKLFLLSVDEVFKYFNSSTYTRCQAGRFIQQDEYVDWYWWLRTPGYTSNMACFVGPDGIVNTGGAYANDPDALIRPAMWVKIS